MSTFLAANNAKSTLATGIGPSVTSISLASGTGALFPSPGAGQIFAVTIQDAATGLVLEICYCTSRTVDTLTVQRGQEGTTALTWPVGSLISNYWTMGTFDSLVQVPYVQQQPGNFGDDTGTANAIQVVLSPAVASLTNIVGAPIRVLKGNLANTGDVTLKIGTLAAAEVVYPGGSALGSGALAANAIFTVVYDGAVFELQSISSPAGSLPPSGPAGGDLTGNYPNPLVGGNKVTNPKLAQATAMTLKGNLTGGTADVADNDISDVADALGGFSGSGSVVLPNPSSSAGTIGSEGSFTGVGGEIHKWCYINVLDPGNGVETVTTWTFATPFPNKCLSVRGTNYALANGQQNNGATDAGARSVLSLEGQNTTQTNVVTHNPNTTTSSFLVTFLLEAWGY